MKHVLASLTVGACLLLLSASVVFAENPHMGSSKGQPGTTAGVNCGTTSAGTLATPGNAALSPGAPFNEPAPAGTSPTGGKAGQVYAGSATSPTMTNGQASSNAVSQYDIACLQVTTQVP